MIDRIKVLAIEPPFIPTLAEIAELRLDIEAAERDAARAKRDRALGVVRSRVEGVAANG